MIGYVEGRPVLWRGPSPEQMVYLGESGYAKVITDNYIVGSSIWNATTLARYDFVPPDLPAGIVAGGIPRGVRKTSAGLDIFYSGYVVVGTIPKIYILHVPTNLLP